MINNSLDFIDFFAGIGGFRKGMEQAGHRCVGHVEWDEFARKSYEAIHNTENEWSWEDVSTIDYRSLPHAGCWCFGFPCTDISNARIDTAPGFEGDRSSLYFAITKRLRQIKEWCPERMPSYLFIENVEDFLSVNDGWDFLKAQIELDEIGYDAEWQVINTKGYLPQNRSRVFIIGHLRGRSTRKIFPIPEKVQLNRIKVIGRMNLKGPDVCKRVYHPGGIGPALTTMGGGNREPKIVDKTGEVRKMTEKEMFRVQGFTDDDYEKAASVNKPTQLKKQIGNSVSVPVIYEIAKRLA